MQKGHEKKVLLRNRLPISNTRRIWMVFIISLSRQITFLQPDVWQDDSYPYRALYLFIRKIELWILKLANKSTNSFCFTYLSKGPSSDGTKDFKIIKPQISLWSWRPLRPFALSSSHFIKRWLETSSANSKFLFVLHWWGCVSTQKVCN